jgi:hypothetical protein
MLVRAFSLTILLLATVGSSAVARRLSLLPQQQQQQVEPPADAMNTGNETLDNAPFRSLLPMNGAAMLDSIAKKPGNCVDQTSKLGYTTRSCTTTIAGFKVEMFYVITPNGAFIQFCMTVAGIPCKDSASCTNSKGIITSTQSYDCRNTALRNSKTACGGVDCQGKCLPKLSYIPSFANGNNGCATIIDLDYQAFPYGSNFLDQSSWVDILGDGKVVGVEQSQFYPDLPKCTATINGKFCTSCTPCFPSPLLIYPLSYDCSNLSTGPCAKKKCNVCADKTTKSLTKDALTVVTKEASAEETTPVNQTLTVLANASSAGVVAKATVPANSTPVTTSATSSVLATTAPSAGAVLASALAGAVWMMAILMI